MEGYPRFVLPEFPDLPPARYRPDFREIEAAAVGWIREEMLDVFECEADREFFIEQRTSLWEILCYPTASAERLLHICNMIDLLFALDTAAAKATLNTGIDNVLKHGCCAIDHTDGNPGSPWLRTLDVVARRFKSAMSAPLWQRYVCNMQGFFAGIVAERRLLREGKLADFDQYDEIRQQTIAGPALALIEYGLGIDLTAEITAYPELASLSEAVARHWIAINDIFSYRKELYAGDTTNKLTLLITMQSLPLQEAVDRVADIARDAAQVFHERRQTILVGPLGNSLKVRRYIEALQLMMTGNLEWSYLTPRYHGRGHVWNCRRSGAVVLAPSQTIFEEAVQTTSPVQASEVSMRLFHQSLHIHTQQSFQFIDLTEALSDLVHTREITHGFINVQTRHTTTAIIVNEHEPLLLVDMKRMLEKMAPHDHAYQHDDFSIRTANLCSEERANGHSHCRAMLLGTSETLNILDGRIQLGQWQRIFFVELDGARERTVSVMILGG